MQNLLAVAIKAALEAGMEILKVYGTNFDVEIKGDNSPLTQADKNANEVIMGYLKTTGIPIISEESRQIDYSVRKNWSRCWIVDPLDGTKEFIKRNGEFTVNIALIEEGDPILGVIYVPVSKELYFTCLPAGTASEDGKTSKKITVSCASAKASSGTRTEEISVEEILKNAENIGPAKITSTVKIVGSRSHLNEDTKNFISEIENRLSAEGGKNEVEIVSKGSSLKFCLVAEGLAHIYPRYAPTMEWDTAAGHAICRAVGVSVIDQTTKKPMRYNKPNLLNNYFVVKAQ